ncbi:MAG: glycosyltransferase, partial [Lachnospiraceae bacterium]
FSVAPLHFVSAMGILTTFIAVLAIIFVIVRQLAFGGSAYGWPSLVCIILLLGGLLIFSIGIVGEYLAKMYLEIKDRPVYIVKEEE